MKPIIFEKLEFFIYEFTTRVTKSIIFPPGFIGIHLRNSIGNALNKTTHPNRFQEIWDKKITKSEQVQLKVGVNPPRGYIIEPPFTNQRRFDEDDILKFKIVLVGTANQFIDDFIKAVTELGVNYWLGREKGIGRGNFNLINVENITPSLAMIYNCDDIKANQLILNFITPTRIEKEKSFEPIMMDKDDKLNFEVLLKVLFQRLNLLQRIFCKGDEAYLDKENELLAKGVLLQKNSLSFLDYDDINKKNSKKLGGFVGEVIYKGNIAPFINLVRLGEYLHVGSDYVYGFGKYEILN